MHNPVTMAVMLIAVGVLTGLGTGYLLRPEPPRLSTAPAPADEPLRPQLERLERLLSGLNERLANFSEPLPPDAGATEPNRPRTAAKKPPTAAESPTARKAEPSAQNQEAIKQRLYDAVYSQGMTWEQLMRSEDMGALPENAQKDVMREVVRKLNNGEIDPKQFLQRP